MYVCVLYIYIYIKMFTRYTVLNIYFLLSGCRAALLFLPSFNALFSVAELVSWGGSSERNWAPPSVPLQPLRMCFISNVRISSPVKAVVFVIMEG